MKDVTKLIYASAFSFVSGIVFSVTLLRFFPNGLSKQVKSIPVRKWKPGKKQFPPFDPEDTIQIHSSQSDSSTLYPLVISTVVPRPIAFISSLSKEGNGNLSPYSYFNVLCHDPPTIAIGHCWSKGRPKDSLQNILETKEFVVGIISDWLLESANHTCGSYPPETNEMTLSNLTPLPSTIVKPPRIAECAINLECKIKHTYDLTNKNGVTSCTVILADVLIFHLSKYVLSESPNSKKVIVDPYKLRPAARLGGNFYGFMDSVVDMPRPDRNGFYPGQEEYEQSVRDASISLKK